MKKNKRLLILVGMLLVFGGFTFAYFVGRMLTDGSGATTTVTTAELKNSKVTVEGTLEFDYKDMLPGHKDVSGIIVTATGNNELIPYNLVWKGSNNLNTDLKFTVYKVSEPLEIKSSCNQIKKNVSGGIMMYEECEISNITSLGEAISEGTIPKNSTGTTVTLAPNEFITSTSTGAKAYYYVIVEYPNLDENQKLDMGQGFEGEVTVEPSNIEPDINILAINVYNEETGKYEESKTIPQEGYTINSEKSHCSNGATPSWDIKNKGVLVTNLKPVGTECYLFFDELCNSNACKIILEGRNIVEGENGFETIDDEEHLNENTKTIMYKDEDDFGDTYYFRGKVKDNWVQFGKTGNDSESGTNIYWRIVRINGDGSIRLIYAGTGNSAKNLTTDGEYTGNKTYSQITTSMFNLDHRDNKDAGFQFISGDAHGFNGKNGQTATDSTALTQLNNFFKNNLIDEWENGNIDINNGFCNDRRNTNSEYTKWGEEEDKWGIGDTATYYGANLRLHPGGVIAGIGNRTKQTFKCKDIYNDYFTYKESIIGNKSLQYPIGLLSVDEAVYAGALAGKDNSYYYLKSNTNYWTMSPSNKNSYVSMYYIGSDGGIYSINPSEQGIRPVINIKASSLIIGGVEGTYGDPYIVVTE